jgi:transposase-like protein
MSRKMTKYSTELKTKLVLAVLSGDKTLNEIATANYILYIEYKY